jgi:hypothetical protein
MQNLGSRDISQLGPFGDRSDKAQNSFSGLELGHSE